MKNLIKTMVLACSIALAGCTGTTQNEANKELAPIPHLEKRGNVTQLIVEGKPYLALGIELTNSAASSR
ncbi:MAG: hypothetical protein IKA00_09655, partial [Prevotella sp.]|nr:hypothetical protein [Prevotella sp.]